MEINRELFENVKAHILAEPLRLDMEEGLRTSSVAPCGTAGCIAGWAAILSGRITHAEVNNLEEKGISWYKVSTIAMDVLGLSGTTSDHDDLFYPRHWPEPFKAQYFEAYFKDDRAGTANAVAARIQSLLDTGV